MVDAIYHRFAVFAAPAVAVRVRYCHVHGRIGTFAVWLVDRIDWLIGWVRQTESGRWNARRRDDADDLFMGGFLDRSNATIWLLTSGRVLFAHRRAA